MTDLSRQAEIQALQNEINELRVQNAMLDDMCKKYRDDFAKNDAARELKIRIASLISISGYEVGREDEDWQTLTLRLLKTGIDFDTIMKLVKSNYMLMSEWEKFMVAIRMAEK